MISSYSNNGSAAGPGTASGVKRFQMRLDLSSFAFVVVLACSVSLPTLSFAQNDPLTPPPIDGATPVTQESVQQPDALVAPTEPASSADPAMDELLQKIGDAGKEVQDTPPTVEETPADAESAPAAKEETAESDPAVPDVVPEQADEAAKPPSTDTLAKPEEEAKNVPEVPALPATEAPDENLFFDANELVPSGEMAIKGTPRKVNPALQPASKLIVVKKDYAPNSRQAQLVSADRAIKLGHYDSALELYNQLYEKNKKDQHILIGRAIALQHLGQDDEAVSAYEQVLDVDPDNAEAQVNMAGIIGKRYPAVAIQKLSDLYTKNPRNVSILGQMAVMHAGLGQYQDAFKYLGMASSIEPHNANHLFNMGVIADRAGKKDQAIKYYEDALEMDTIYGGGRSVPRESIYERLAQMR